MRTFGKFVLVLVAMVNTVIPAAAASQPVIVVRASRLDAITASWEQLAAAIDLRSHVDPADWLATTAGLPNGSAIDRTRPIYLAVPTEGLLDAANSYVLALPLKNSEQALASMARTPDKPTGDDPTRQLVITVVNDYLVVAKSTAAARAFDLALLTTDLSLPTGDLALAIQVEQVAPLLKAWLPRLRDGLATSIEGSPRRTDESSGTPATLERQAAEGLADLYVSAWSDILDNLSSLQFSLELQAGQLWIRQRSVARPESTLLQFLDQQQERSTISLSRFLPPQTTFSWSGQMTWTSAARAWSAQFDHRMAQLRRKLDTPPSVPPDAAPLVGLGLPLAPYATLAACDKGEFAVAIDLLATPPSSVTLLGVQAQPECKSLPAELAVRLRASPSPARVTKERLRSPAIDSWLVDTEIASTLRVLGNLHLPGAGRQTLRFGLTDGVLVRGSDEWATRALRDLHAAARSADKPTLLAKQVAGGVGQLDLGRVARQWLFPKAGANGSAAADDALVESLRGAAGKIPLAWRLERSGMTVEIGLPLKLFEAVVKSRAIPHNSASLVSLQSEAGDER